MLLALAVTACPTSTGAQAVADFTAGKAPTIVASRAAIRPLSSGSVTHVVRFVRLQLL